MKPQESTLSQSRVPLFVIAVFLLIGTALIVPSVFASGAVENYAAPIAQAGPTINGQLDTCDPSYNRLFNATSVSTVGTNVYYETVDFTVAATGSYSITMSAASIPDGHASLYQAPFNPAAPQVNALFVDDDSGPGVNPAFLNVTLQTGVTYVLVTSSLNNGMTGTYTWTFPSGVTLGANSISTFCPTATPTPSPTFTPTPTNTPLPQVVEFSGQLDTCDPTYNRLLNVGSTSIVGTNVFHEVQQFSVSATGPYKVSMIATTISDGYATLYRDTFNPATPLVNAVFVDDDSGSGVNPAFIDVVLEQGFTYLLVTSSLNNGMTGTYTWTITGSPIITLGANTVTLGCPLPTNTFTPSYTPSNTPTPTHTPTDAPPTATLTPTNTPTDVPPTATYTPTNTPTDIPPTATSTPTNTPTDVPPTATHTPTNTPTDVPPTATLTPSNTPTQIPSVIPLSIDSPSNGSTVSTSFNIAGWSVNPAAGNGAGPGVNLIRVYQGGACAGTVLGETVPNVPRPDVALTYGLDASYTNSGFTIPTVSAPGSLTFTVCARSSQTNAFEAAQTRTVNVVTNVRLYIDAPANGGVAGTRFNIVGWSVNPSAGVGGGTGVNLVRVYEGNTCAGTVLAEGATSIPRPDVLTVLALDASYVNSGFSFALVRPAGPLTYTVCARSSQTNTFEKSETRTVTINSNLRLNVDAPGNGTTQSTTMTVRGWAVELSAGAGNGTGIVSINIFGGSACSGTQLGSAVTNISRPGVSTLFGLDASYINSGWSTNITLPVGSQTFTVCALSAVSGAYDRSVTRTVNVIGGTGLDFVTSTPTPIPTDVPTDTPPLPTATATIEPTAVPTEVPTNTPEPPTAEPTLEPPTATPEPTLEPPTATPEPSAEVTPEATQPV